MTTTQVLPAEFPPSLLTVIDGQPKADSRTVAEVFRKEHKHVLRDIEELEIPADFRESNFGLSKYKSAGSRRSYPHYLMTRDGFTLLAMGFTGKSAMEWKLKFIDAFNSMEKSLTTLGNVVDVEKLAACLAPRLLGRDVLPTHPGIEDEALSRAEIVIDACGVNLLPQPDCVYLMQRLRRKTDSSLGGSCTPEYYHLRDLLFKRFGVRSFVSLRKVDFRPALEFIDSYNSRQKQMELLRNF